MGRHRSGSSICLARLRGGEVNENDALFLRLGSWLRHKLGLNRGTVESWTAPDGHTYVGFLCECGMIHGVEDMANLTDSAIVEEWGKR
jgi:hypothetical protein